MESDETALAFLRCHEPFDAMHDDALNWLAVRLESRSFARGEVLHSPRDGPIRHLYIVRRGSIGSRPDTLQGEIDRTFMPGDMFPVGALVAGGATTRTFVGTADGACLMLACDDFAELRRASPQFDRFCANAVAETLRFSLESLYAQYDQRAAEERTLATPIGELVRRAPVSCPANAPLSEAVRRMSEGSVRTVIAVDGGGAPIGMFTLVDLLNRVVLAGRALDRPLSEAMSAPIHTLPPSAPAYEALQLMAEVGVRQLIVADAGALQGVVSERDIASLQRVSVGRLATRLRSAASVEQLARASVDVRRLATALLAQGIGAEALTRTISSLNDTLTRRAIELVRARHDVEDVDWCWLSLGSEGRGEQTIASDQDNALAFRVVPGQDPAALRKRLIPFAREVNEALDAMGFTLCAGNVMASNPELCLSVEEWRFKFLQWLLEPTPEALLNANIVFDFRPLAGDAAIAAEMREWMSGYVRTSTLFLRLMVENALDVEVPLGLIRTFSVDDGPGAKGTIDLKTRGTRLFVDCARVFALEHGIVETGTAERLRRVAPALRMENRDVDAAIEAFQFLQMLRMRQQEGGQGHGVSNRVDPYSLNEIEQRILQEAFRQARQLQERLRLAYRL